MYGYIEESLLTDWFLLDFVLGGSIDRRKTFDALGRIYMLPSEKADELYDAGNDEEVLDMRSEKDYNRFRRICEYLALGGDEPEETDAVKVRGSALACAARLGLRSADDTTPIAAYKALCSAAETGSVTALRLLGIMRCEGFSTAKNSQLGIKNLTKAAMWNNIEGVLAALYYDPRYRKTNMDRLFTLTNGTPYKCVYDEAAKLYGEGNELEECGILEKAFAYGIVAREGYVSQYARIIFGQALRTIDKERVVFSRDKSLTSATCELPLKFSVDDIECDLSALDDMPIDRRREKEKILQGVENSKMRSSDAFKPMCIRSNTRYVLNAYADALEKLFVGAHVSRINVASLSAHELNPDKNNIFLRSCRESENNVYLLFMMGDVPEANIEAVKNFLRSEKRRNIRLVPLGLEINLGAILPVCICDAENFPHVSKYCDEIKADGVTAKEKPSVLRDILRRKSVEYKVKDITVDDETFDKLLTYSADAAATVLDDAIRAKRRTGESLVLDQEAMHEFFGAKAKATRGYGFGGNEGED